MVTCKNCSRMNKESEKFCEHCGAELLITQTADPIEIYREAVVNAIEDGKVPVAARRRLMEIQMQYNLDPMEIFALEKEILKTANRQIGSEIPEESENTEPENISEESCEYEEENGEENEEEYEEEYEEDEEDYDYDSSCVNYQIKLVCNNHDDAEKLYAGFDEEGWLGDETLSIFAPGYDCEMDFEEACHAVNKESVVLSGFSGYCGKDNVWNLIQAFKEKGEDNGVVIKSYVIKIRGAENYIFQDFYHPAPEQIAEKLKENLDLNDSDTREAFEEAVNYVWGFEIDEDKRADLAEQDEENMMCGEPGIIDEILKKAACGDFGDESYYIQINGGGVQDEDTNLSYLQDSCQTLDNQTPCEENLLEEAIQNYNQAEKSGSRADKEKAFSSLEKICAETADCPEALYLLGMCYIKEWGCKKNLQRSFELFTQAAQMDHPKAKWKLGLYYEGKGNVVEKDYSKACNFYTEAAEAGVVEAQRLLGRLCLQMGDIEKGRECLRDAIAAGDDKAKNLLAAYYIQQVEIFDKRIAVTPDIDAGNLRRANLEYAIPYGIYNSPDELMENALVLIGDDDPTGGASGVLITTRGIFSQEKSLFKKTQHSAKLTASTQITLPDDTLYVDAEPFFRFKKASTEDIRNLIAALKRYQKDL